ncbi:MAG: hypothetical protein U0Z26_08510 [Anaerolineales bacterium]
MHVKNALSKNVFVPYFNSEILALNRTLRRRCHKSDILYNNDKYFWELLEVMKKKAIQLSPYLITAIGYITWASFYIFKSSYIAIDGNRYFSLLDDAMISMRYAWNFSHGLGLVWNTGERVEGYSNLLMTLIMSIATYFFEKKWAVLAIQIFGILIVLVSAYLSSKIASEFFENKYHVKVLAFSVFLLTLFYYPLSYWSLLGMETGLVTALTLVSILYVIRWTKNRHTNLLFVSSVFSGLAFLTRNDALIFTIVNFTYAGWVIWKERDKQNTQRLINAMLMYAIVVLGMFFFRWMYYGTWVPNTYTLKLGLIPLSVRLNDGLLYVFQFSLESWLLLLLALASFAIARGQWKWYLIGFIGMAFIYQIWTGGDAWRRWRFFVPAIPLLFILCINLANIIVEGATKKIKSIAILIPFSTLSIFVFALTINTISPYWKEVTLSSAIPDRKTNQHNTDVAIAINATTKSNAKIGVFLAGVIPYYSDRYAFDFLGKSDVHIASLYPHLPSKVIWFHKTTLPGHNKYDLYYSIKDMKPVYIQRDYWGEQYLRHFAVRNYVRFEYYDTNGMITLLLLKDSSDVYWERGVILKWPHQ